ncbi:hypothetical protein F4813DRAFT_387887 [Daldinia decipiens]|uniref:uncharacterized protein n=1 Tax=Daldinia decipiens TaxID=326647 RepID=UPI0020C40CC5|nr:uncharacterized protein F4813DRAFT_387887 [Daldinia decipiens]KAI1659178.1 hypothetical protein F4813DRAFT_387887 [Daldinia decipiens]
MESPSTVFDRQVVMDWLTSRTTELHEAEETNHPWQVQSLEPFHQPLLRFWDEFSGSPLVDVVAEERPHARNRRVTAIDPNIRIKNGLPVIDVEAEIKHYRIKPLYAKSEGYAKGHCMFLWQVTKDEIVGSRKWTDLEEGDKNWYNNIIMPAYRKFVVNTTITPLEASFEELPVIFSTTDLEDTGSSSAKQ